MPKAKKRKAVAGKPAAGKVTIKHVMLSLHHIEAWCNALREIIGNLGPDTVVPVTQEQSDAILKGSVVRIQGGTCPPPVRVIDKC
jgi:hypothetical protein